MGTLAEARNGIRDNIAADAAFEDWNLYKWEPRNPHPRSVIVSWPEQYDPQTTYAGDTAVIIPVRFELPWLDDEQADIDLMDAMDNARDAIETDRTLGGKVDDLSCGPFTDIGARTMPDDTVTMQFVVPVTVYL